MDVITLDMGPNHHRTWVLSKDSRACMRVNTGIPLLNVGMWAGVTITLLASRVSSLFFVTGSHYGALSGLDQAPASAS